MMSTLLLLALSASGGSEGGATLSLDAIGRHSEAVVQLKNASTQPVGLFGRNRRSTPTYRTQPRQQTTPPTVRQQTTPAAGAESAVATPSSRDRFGLREADYLAVAAKIRPIVEYAENPDDYDAIPSLNDSIWPAAAIGRLLSELPPLPASKRAKISSTLQNRLREKPIFELTVANAFVNYLDAKLVHAGPHEGSPTLIYGITKEGMNHFFLELTLQKDNRGRLYIVDVTDHRADLSDMEAVLVGSCVGLLEANRLQPFLNANSLQVVQAYGDMAKMVQRQGEWSETEFADAVAALPPTMRRHHLVLFAAVINAASRSDLESLLLAAETYRAAYPKRLAVDTLFASFGIGDGLYEEVYEAADRLLARFPNDEQLKLRMAIAKLAMGEAGVAKMEFRAAAAMNEDRDATYIAWVAFCFQLEEYQVARDGLLLFDAACDVDLELLGELKGYEKFLATESGRRWKSYLGDRFDAEQVAGNPEDRLRL